MLEEGRLVSRTVNKLREDGGFSSWENYEVLGGSKKWVVCSWKEKIKMRNEKDWEEEVSNNSTLKRYTLAKNAAGVERY